MKIIGVFKAGAETKAGTEAKGRGGEAATTKWPYILV